MFNLSHSEQATGIITIMAVIIILWYKISDHLWKRKGSPKGLRQAIKVESCWPDKIYQKRWLNEYLHQMRKTRNIIKDFYSPIGIIPKGLAEIDTQIGVFERVQLWLDMHRTIEPKEDLANRIYYELGIEASYINPEELYSEPFNYRIFFETQEERELNGEATEWWKTENKAIILKRNGTIIAETDANEFGL